MSGRRPTFSRRARIDLRQIYRSSRTTWGDVRADAYRDRLDEALARIARFPEVGTSFPELAANARRLVVAQYTIVYLVREDGVYIVRVVHHRMSLDDVAFA